MKQDEQKTIEVNIAIIKAILKKGISAQAKADSLLRDHYMSGFTFSDQDLTSLSDIRASSHTLVSYLEDLVEQTIEAGTNAVYLPQEELKIIATLVQALSIAQTTKVGTSNMRDH